MEEPHSCEPGQMELFVDVVVGPRVWDTLTPAVQDASSVIAAIAYVGAGADELLPLKSGSVIIVNAGEATVQQGSTDPRILLRWHEAGVTVLSLPTLHAKLISVGGLTPLLVVGSANVSTNSADRLDEATMMTTDPVAIDVARDGLHQMIARASLLTTERLRELAALYATHRPPAPVEPPARVDDLLWPRPAELFLVGMYDAGYSEDLLDSINETSAALGIEDDPEDDYADGQYEVTVVSFTEDAQAARPFGMNFTVGSHIIKVSAPENGPIPRESAVSPPGRVLGVWIDEQSVPRVRHTSLLVRHYGPQRTLGDVEDALDRIGLVPSYNRSYCTPEQVTAILNLWPAATYDIE